MVFRDGAGTDATPAGAAVRGARRPKPSGAVPKPPPATLMIAQLASSGCHALDGCPVQAPGAR